MGILPFKLDSTTLIVLFTIVAVAGASLFSFSKKKTIAPETLGSSIFDFTVESVNGPLALSSIKGKKAYLIVNVASRWGLTKSNYQDLAALYSKYKDQGLEILAFPCNKFAKQESGTNEEIVAWAKEIGVDFPILGKLDCVGGTKSHPLFQYLTRTIGGGFFGDDLKWNFHKFLCDENGIPVQRYGPTDYSKNFEVDVVQLLAKVDVDTTVTRKQNSEIKEEKPL